MLILHVADLHLGSGISHGPIALDGVRGRLHDFTDTWLQCCELAEKSGVEVVVFAGDAFRTGQPSPTELRSFGKGLRRLRQAGIKVICAVGNHDWSGVEGEATGLDIFEDPGWVEVASRPRLIRVGTESGPLQLAVLPYFRRSHLWAAHPDMTREQVDAMAGDMGSAMLQGMVAEADRGQPLIAVVHHNIAGARLSTGWETAGIADPLIPLQPLRDLPVQYVAAGHIHKLQNLGVKGGPAIVYPGSPDTVDFGEEQEPCGCVLVDVPDRRDQLADWSYHPLRTRPFLTLAFDLTEEQDPDPMASLGRAMAGQKIEGAVLRIRYRARQDQQSLVSDVKIRSLCLQAGASHVSTVESTILCPDREVIEGLNQGLTTEQAVQIYMEARPEYRDRVDTLMTRFGELMQELVTGR